jgi:hypothetical protein
MISTIISTDDEKYEFEIFNGYTNIRFRVKEKYLKEKWVGILIDYQEKAKKSLDYLIFD